MFSHPCLVGPFVPLRWWDCVCTAGTDAAPALSIQKRFQPFQLPDGHLIRPKFVSGVKYRLESYCMLHGGIAKQQTDVGEGLVETMACHQHKAKYPETANHLC